jgi:hypothetical protein
MPKITANGITMNYEQQGTGEPLVLIPYLAADNACYAFQVADYSKHFTCISVDPRGAGETDKPAGTYSMELFADDVAAFMQAIGVERAHVSGLSLGDAGDGQAVVAKMKELPTDDPLFGRGTIRIDGRKIHPVYLYETKKPSESKGEWDYFKLVTTIPAEQAFRPLSEGGCSLVKG